VKGNSGFEGEGNEVGREWESKRNGRAEAKPVSQSDIRHVQAATRAQEMAQEEQFVSERQLKGEAEEK
jgi:hypothetical protein